MSDLYPLRFHPRFRSYLWGGRRLGSVLGKPLGDEPRYAESWEVVDHGDDQSVVANGRCAGLTLHQLLQEYGPQLMGRDASRAADQFPLLLKYLDADQNLSVQVHPNDQQAARLTPPDLGKTEAWVVLHAEPGSQIYAGLKQGFDRAALEREVRRGTTELCLHRLTPQVGDCIFIPAGVVHAIGAGLLIAEIQQASDTTFRLFDWNRVDANGQPRTLHIDQALDTIDYGAGPVQPQIPRPGRVAPSEVLVQCEQFQLERWTWQGRQTLQLDDRCHILTVLQGRLAVAGGGLTETLGLAETTLLPACLDTVQLDALEPTVALVIMPGS